jgi:N-acetylglucosamine-6-phosphate deacetylase
MPAFIAARILAPQPVPERALLLVDEGRIVDVAPLPSRPIPAGVSVTDFGENIVAPGYIDLHIHGSAGYDVMDDSPEALPEIERMLACHGVTAYLPTTVTAPIDSTLGALERLADAIEEHEQVRNQARGDSLIGRAQPLGIHLEGPFISHVRRGVHAAEQLLAPKVEIFERFWQAARGRIRMMTIAPELDGALELIATAASRGVCVSLGHSDADFAAAERGVAAGARHATHTFNAMRPLGHRDPGIVGAVLTDRSLSVDLIADGIHLDPAIVKLIAQAKGPEHTVLITDAVSATGMPDGRYRLGSMAVDVNNGRCESAGKLAGSVLTMDRAVRNLGRFAEWDLATAIATASRNPARVLASNNKGVLAPGADGDFIVLDPQGNVLRTFIGGIERSL